MSAISKLGRCLVIGFCGDIMIDWQQKFITMWMRHEVQMEVLFYDSGFHAIDLPDLECANTIMEKIEDFIAEC